LLTTVDPLIAKEIAEQLSVLNSKRQKMEEQALNEAIGIVEAQQLARNPVILVGQRSEDLVARAETGERGTGAETGEHGTCGETGERETCADAQVGACVKHVAHAQAGTHTETITHDSAMKAGHTPNWHPGIVGLLASRLKEKYCRPVFVFTSDAGSAASAKACVVKGSCRSIEGINVGELVREGVERGILLGGGGHAMAAGFSFELCKWQMFYDFLNEKTQAFMASYSPIIDIDMRISIRGITPGLLEEIEILEPFGVGNHEPKFCISNVRAGGIRVVGSGTDGGGAGSGKHIQCRLYDETNASINAICFRGSGTIAEEVLASGRVISVVGVVKRDAWRGGNNFQFIIEDACIGSAT
jgi:single-stranded-DNA-specific exonuclease